ncbi:MAG: Mur ligase domain-containing protein [Victivallaceae bacterium]|nr:Mur ligase domain-containing protein [Victivallaceae bacterium]
MLNEHSKVHMVGIGGIGMSGLAQLLAAIGCRVSGSDRDSDKPQNRALFDALRSQGIAVYPQDGSFAAAGLPDAVIYSTAVEEGNPDFVAAGDSPRLHRSQALEQAVNLYAAGATLAVTGSSGKTSVTAYVAEALNLLGIKAGCLDGGMVRNFCVGDMPGNFHPGRDIFVFEADESDKSLLNYEVDYAVILNIGCDHYSEEELARVFGEFTRRVRKGVAMSGRVFAAVRSYLRPELEMVTFAENSGEPDVDFSFDRYRVDNGRAFADLNGEFALALPQPGVHTASNLAAVAAALSMLGVPAGRLADISGDLRGASRRFEFVGRRNGAPVYDDYAHNPQKLACCLRSAQSLASGRVFMIWQPHGYGPLGFMREELGRSLRATLRGQDVFWLLEPFYAGGTSSFSPHAAEVADHWAIPNAGAPGDRAAVEALLAAAEPGPGDLIMVCGARDNTIPEWANSLTRGGR